MGDPRMVVSANDYIGHWIAVAGVYELSMLLPAMAFLKERGFLDREVCLDVGANIGNHSVFFSQYFSRVLALEANPRVFDLLAINAATNGARNGAAITCRNIAVGDGAGEVTIRIPDGTNEGTGTVLGHGGSGEGARVTMDRLDAIAADFGEGVGLIKIDVEGMEQAVLDGAGGIIARNAPAILFEYHKHLQGDRDTLDLLQREHGYDEFYHVCPAIDLQGTSSAMRNAAHVIVNFLTNSRFVVKPVALPAMRSHDLVIALKSGGGARR